MVFDVIVLFFLYLEYGNDKICDLDCEILTRGKLIVNIDLRL